MKISPLKTLASVGALVAAVSAQAVVDVTAVTAAVQASMGPAEAVGVAIIIAYAGLFAFKLIKRLL